MRIVTLYEELEKMTAIAYSRISNDRNTKTILSGNYAHCFVPREKKYSYPLDSNTYIIKTNPMMSFISKCIVCLEYTKQITLCSIENELN